MARARLEPGAEMTGATESAGRISLSARRPATEEARPAALRTAFPHRGLFWMLALFLVLEYARPPVIVQLRLQMLISFALPIAWLTSKDRPWSGILAAQALFLALCASMVPFAYNYYAAYFTTRIMFANVAVAFAMSWLWSHRPLFRTGYWVWLLVMAYVGFFGFTHGGRGPGGFLGDENDLALACAAAFPFAFLGFQELRGWQRWTAGISMLLLVMAVVASFSRGGFLGLAAAALYCVLTGRHLVRNLAIGAVGTAVFVVLVSPAYLAEMGTITETESGTAEGRRFLWTTAYNMWLDHPVAGVGGGNFNFQAGSYQPHGGKFDTPDYTERDWSGTTVHSLYFQMLAEHGTLGIGLLAFVVVAHYRLLRRLRRSVNTTPNVSERLRCETELFSGALGGAMAGFLVAGAFISVVQYPYAWYFSAMAVGLDTAVRRELHARGRRPSPDPPAPRVRT